MQNEPLCTRLVLMLQSDVMAHIHEKIDFTVEVFVVHKDRVLLRKHEKYGIWLSVGGHIELNEDPNEAALREVKEEVGLDVVLNDTRSFTRHTPQFTELIAPISLNRHRISDTHEHISLIYFARAATDVVIPERDTDEWQWCTAEDITTMPDLQPNVAYYAKQALSILS